MENMASAQAIEPVKRRAADERNDRAVKKPRKTISVAGLFSKKPSMERPEAGAGIDNDKKHPRTHQSEDVETARAKVHPVYLEVKEATEGYLKESKGSLAEQLDADEQEFLARIEGMDINGKPLCNPGGPSKAEMQALKDDQDLLRPLTEDVLTVAITRSDGTVAHKDVKLCDSIEKMRNLVDETEVKLRDLLEELNEVDAEIKHTWIEYDNATREVGEGLRNNLARYESGVQAWHKQTLDDIAKARKEDKAHGIEANRKLQEFAASLC